MKITKIIHNALVYAVCSMLFVNMNSIVMAQEAN